MQESEGGRQKMKMLLGFGIVSPALRSGIPQVYHLFVTLLGYYFNHSFVFIVFSTYYISRV